MATYTPSQYADRSFLSGKWHGLDQALRIILASPTRPSPVHIQMVREKMDHITDAIARLDSAEG
jgi:hypothetical protein